ncbi:hypothetical protein RHSIM_Rhsim06G0090600 [Rhododendron simsii]|uniref:Uncharacterized protein n=1 Tax=Rhododendron simsii TaxID=118357 RepID=A0A834GUJ2_RHOSS|nr:hypothetical protein RHSIM_Rhsim06G0090600 [Rhododendron simsii]
MIKWHQACVTTANYSLSINGEVIGYILGKRGLRGKEGFGGGGGFPGKSNIYFFRVNTSFRFAILGVLGFREGTFPVRYLRVPLLSTKLKSSNCQRIVDSIIAKTKSWTNKDLTYAGRLQLIKNALFSIQTYWSSLSVIPKEVIKEVESIRRAFLWIGTDLRKTGASLS